MFFLKWILAAAVIGAIGGLIGTAFHYTIVFVASLRENHPWLILLLPAGGLLIVFLYRLAHLKRNRGTNEVMDAADHGSKLSPLVAPLIFLSTAITHLFGGSAGREGAALQLGGSLGYNLGKLFRSNYKDLQIFTLVGMSCVFAAMFGTPVTAAVFVIEFIQVGVVNYTAFVPCIVSALVAAEVARLLGGEAVMYSLSAIPEINAKTLIYVLIISIACAIVGVLFCLALHKTEHYAAKWIKSPYLRIFAGGAVITVLTIILGTSDYNGAGSSLVLRAIEQGETNYEAFALKLIFTAITIGVGYKGGEIVPTFFIGSTLGCALAAIIGFDPCFGAAVGLVGMFCAVTNCPIASIMLSAELFGAQGLALFAVASAVCYILSGKYSLYTSQMFFQPKIDN